jgi:hypothetical protein
LADRLVTARRSRFVGRETELSLFRSALLQENPPFVVLHIHGPGGVGKTALLRTYAQLAADVGCVAIYLDGRNLEPSPVGFLRAVEQTLGSTGSNAPLVHPEWPARGVLLLDTYETLISLDSWLRESLLPQLPDRWLVVIAGRNPPAPAWSTDLDWGEFTHIIPLRNLRPEETQTFLATRGVPEQQHAELLAVTHGHPLALCLVADALTQGGHGVEINLRNEPDIVRTLLERFLSEIPSAKHRLALEVCVMAWATTETLLAYLLGEEDAYITFEWLRRLSFIEQGPQGLFPHDLAREVLDVDFRWRNSDAHRELYRQLVAHLYQRLLQAESMQQQRIWFDILYLARHNPYMKPYFDWQALGGSYAEAATESDLPTILAMVEAHEGHDQAQLVSYWWGRQPRAFLVYRQGSEVIGFMAHLALHLATAEDIATDPALAPALAFAERYGPVRADEEMMYLRFWMGRDAHQGVSPAINLTAINASIYWTTHPKLAWNFIAVADPEYLQPHFTMIAMRRSPEADFIVEGHRYGVFRHDWRVESATEWMALKADRYSQTEIDLDALEMPKSPTSRPILVLSEPEFVDAVRRALRDYTRPDLLAENPLLRSRLIAEREAGSPAVALQALLGEAVAMLKGNPKDEKLYRALWHTYFEPAATQEQTAELLDLPFSTYRYHLTTGVERVAAWLWKHELQGPNR